jgi:NAD(P)-dependent dehydrogenase (short-subunit alcohol dehydrogenase family)
VAIIAFSKMSDANTNKTWLITGASAGLGLAIALSALKAGHKVIACARNPQKAAREHPDVEGSGGKWLQLDVTSLQTQATVEDVVREEGGVDVIVNNAGYFLPGPIEDIK